MAIIIAFIAAAILISVAILLVPVFQADQKRMVGSNDTAPDVTGRTLMAFGAFLVLSVPSSALWLASVWQ